MESQVVECEKSDLSRLTQALACNKKRTTYGAKL